MPENNGNTPAKSSRERWIERTLEAGAKWAAGAIPKWMASLQEVENISDEKAEFRALRVFRQTLRGTWYDSKTGHVQSPHNFRELKEVLWDILNVILPEGEGLEFALKMAGANHFVFHQRRTNPAPAETTTSTEQPTTASAPEPKAPEPTAETAPAAAETPTAPAKTSRKPRNARGKKSRKAVPTTK